MLNDPVLINDWHVVAYAPDLKEGKPMAVRLLEEDIVLWRVGKKVLISLCGSLILTERARERM